MDLRSITDLEGGRLQSSVNGKLFGPVGPESACGSVGPRLHLACHWPLAAGQCPSPPPP